MADEGEGEKQWLYAWLGKQGLVPKYNICSSVSGTRTYPSWCLCEVTVDGWSYRGIGHSSNKKDAKTNAAKNFIHWLIRSGNLNREDVPNTLLSKILGHHPPTPEPAYVPQVPFHEHHQRDFSEDVAPGDMALAHRPYPSHGTQSVQLWTPSFNPSQPSEFQEIQVENVTEADELDVDAGLHGNWTIENAKAKLHQFFERNKIKAEYIYCGVGRQHSMSFEASCNVYIKQLGTYVNARERGPNKQTASKRCALSLVRQLYHRNVIEAFSGSMRQPQAPDDGVKPKPFEVNVDPSLIARARLLLEELNIQPLPILPSLDLTTANNPEDGPPSVNLIQDSRKDLSFLTRNEENNQTNGIISWSPPVPNWNTWKASNIDEGHMAVASLDQLSQEFLQNFKEKQKVNKKVQEMYKVRSQLPVYSKKKEILEGITEYPIVLIKGDSGSGKTTQICQFILDDKILAGQGAQCNIIVTQPRKFSAISVAERIAHERGEELGMTVGYRVKFESCLPRPFASILFCTVDDLRRKLEGGLRGVSHVIVDEVQERDVNTDFILIVLRDMLATYPDLRVILISASIDETLFTEYFNGCPVIQVEGRAFPVETHFLEDIVETLQFTPSAKSISANKRTQRTRQRWRKAGSAPNENLNIVPLYSNYSDVTLNTLNLLNEYINLDLLEMELLSALLTHIKQKQIPGAILVFLPRSDVIFAVMRYLHSVFGSSTYVILPLYSKLPRVEQYKVFDPVPSNMTKIILSTRIAETSVTIDDVVFVIDFCKTSTKVLTAHNYMTTYVKEWAARSNLLQRRGRAGRVRPGYCYHLVTRARFGALEENMSPQIFRTPLHEIALSIKFLGLGGISQFLSKAPQAPPLDAVIEAKTVLYDLNCLDNFGELTPLGKILGKMPLDPKLGKMIILGTIFGCADPLAFISANSSNKSPVFWLTSGNKRLARQQCDFGASRHSDHFAMLNAVQECVAIRNRRGEDAQDEFCQQRFLSLPSVRKTSDAKNQLLQVLSASEFPGDVLLPVHLNFRSSDSDYELDTLAAVLCSGLYPNVCYNLGKREVLTSDSKFALIQASINCSTFDSEFPYPFFIFGEKICAKSMARARHMTMVTPTHLLLFGARKVEVMDDTVVLDNWITLTMKPEDAAVIVSLRPAIENMITLASENPAKFFPLNSEHAKLVNLIKDLSRLESAKFGQEVRLNRENYENGEFQEYQPRKRIAYQEQDISYDYSDSEGDAGAEGSEDSDNMNSDEDKENGSMLGLKRPFEKDASDCDEEQAVKRRRW